jgi:hypothetical protein
MHNVAYVNALFWNHSAAFKRLIEFLNGIDFPCQDGTTPNAFATRNPEVNPSS